MLTDEHLARRGRATVCTAPTRARVTVCMSYTVDYRLGQLTEAVNRAWAARHGYRFVVEVLCPAAMHDAIEGRSHATWHKVVLLNRLLAEAEEEALAPAACDGSDDAATSYLLWIDADAVVVNHARTVEDLLALADNGSGGDGGGSARHAPWELLIGEDLNSQCLVNAGVMLVRSRSAWSCALWADVWSAAGRYKNKRYWEQSTLQAQLRARGEGLEAVTPFHSYRGGPAGPKRFTHVCVLPRRALNTNAGLEPKVGGGEACEFVFHAVGSWNKMDAVHRMLLKTGTAVPPIFEVLHAACWFNGYYYWLGEGTSPAERARGQREKAARGRQGKSSSSVASPAATATAAVAADVVDTATEAAGAAVDHAETAKGHDLG